MRVTDVLDGGGQSPTADAARLPAPPAPRISWCAIDLVAFVVIYLTVSVPVTTWILGASPAVTWGRPTTLTSTVFAASHLGAVGLIVMIVRVHGGRVAELGWRRTTSNWLLAALPLAAAGSVLVYVLSALSRLGLREAHAVQCGGFQQDMQRVFGGGGAVVLGLFLACVVAPFVEETVWRGFLFGWLRSRLPVPAAVAVSSVIFGLGHVALTYHDIGAFLPMTGFGILLAVVYQRSGSLWPGMLAHGIFNAAGMLNMLHSSC